jgi:hypothetical protein
MAQRIIIRRMASSITEKAQRSAPPKAMGVKTKRKMSINFIKPLNIVIK